MKQLSKPPSRVSKSRFQSGEKKKAAAKDDGTKVKKETSVVTTAIQVAPSKEDDHEDGQQYSSSFTISSTRSSVVSRTSRESISSGQVLPRHGRICQSERRPRPKKSGASSSLDVAGKEHSEDGSRSPSQRSLLGRRSRSSLDEATLREREARSIAIEKAYVHDVYEQISQQLSDSRYRTWPKVKQFIQDLEPGSLVCDVGKLMIHRSAMVWNSAILTMLSFQDVEVASISI